VHSFAEIHEGHGDGDVKPFHSLHVAHLRRAVTLADEVLDIRCRELLRKFSMAAPCVKAVRDTLLHFEDYEIGAGRLQESLSSADAWSDAQRAWFSRTGCDCFFSYGTGQHRVELFSSWRAAREMVDGVFIQLPGCRLSACTPLPSSGGTISTVPNSTRRGSRVVAGMRRCNCIDHVI
jgi:hypothetical protein